MEGQGVSSDCKEAIKWFRISADKGNVEAMGILGVCYFEGQGVSRNCDEAVKWYKIAAEKGNKEAMYNLAYCYANGVGITKDYIQSYAWSSVAIALQGNEESVKLRNALTKKMTPSQIEQGQKLSREILSKQK